MADEKSINELILETLKEQKDAIDSKFNEMQMYIDRRIKDIEGSFDKKFSEVQENIVRIHRRIKDLEEDRRTDLSIARATRRMKFFEKMPQELQGNAFTEDIKDYY